MPVERLEIGQFHLLGLRLLQAALAEAAQPQGHRLAQTDRRLPLADCQQTSLGGQLPLQGLQPLGKVVSGHLRSDESLIEQLAPAGQMHTAITSGPRQVLLRHMAGIHQRNHLELGPAWLQGHQEEHPLGVEGGE